MYFSTQENEEKKEFQSLILISLLRIVATLFILHEYVMYHPHVSVSYTVPFVG